jgi:cytochrome P450
LLPGAVEEILRWANPLHYFRRTATAAAELHGMKIEPGQKVAMFYTSANRDERVFADPHAFDIRRDPNPHVSFGIGEHFCLGAHLARLEGRVFLDELLSAFGTVEQAGPAKRVRSNLNNALKSLPVRLAA